MSSIPEDEEKAPGQAVPATPLTMLSTISTFSPRANTVCE